MREPEKYCGVIPAFYACYDDAGEVSPERVRALAEHLIRNASKAFMWAAHPANVFTKA